MRCLKAATTAAGSSAPARTCCADPRRVHLKHADRLRELGQRVGQVAATQWPSPAFHRAWAAPSRACRKAGTGRGPRVRSFALVPHAPRRAPASCTGQPVTLHALVGRVVHGVVQHGVGDRDLARSGPRSRGRRRRRRDRALARIQAVEPRRVGGRQRHELVAGRCAPSARLRRTAAAAASRGPGCRWGCGGTALPRRRASCPAGRRS